jgi:hypothetical protein
MLLIFVKILPNLRKFDRHEYHSDAYFGTDGVQTWAIEHVFVVKA